MKRKLSLKAEAWNAINGLSMDVPRDPILYGVLGMSEGEGAKIARFPPSNKWSILRIINGESGEWEGSYDTPEEALEALRERR